MMVIRNPGCDIIVMGCEVSTDKARCALSTRELETARDYSRVDFSEATILGLNPKVHTHRPLVSHICWSIESGHHERDGIHRRQVHIRVERQDCAAPHSGREPLIGIG